jgi:hypothetical protein
VLPDIENLGWRGGGGGVKFETFFFSAEPFLVRKVHGGQLMFPDYC